MKTKFLSSITTIVLAILLAPVISNADGFRHLPSAFQTIKTAFTNAQSYDVPAQGRIEVAFSPNEGSENLVVKVIDSARSSLDVLSYSFTSPAVTEAVVRAIHRGVAVRLVADYKNNIVDDHSGKARAALSAIKTAGGDVRVIREFSIHHDKVLLSDNATVELGSFNYSAAAARSNSENVLVNWQNPALAAVYFKHFSRNYQLSEPFQARY